MKAVSERLPHDVAAIHQESTILFSWQAQRSPTTRTSPVKLRRSAYALVLVSCLLQAGWDGVRPGSAAGNRHPESVLGRTSAAQSGSAPGANPGTPEPIRQATANSNGKPRSGGATVTEPSHKSSPQVPTTLLHSFSDTRWREPRKAVWWKVWTANFYGNNLRGGANGYGTYLQDQLCWDLTILRSFSTCPQPMVLDPNGGLVEGTDGYF